MCCGGNKNKPSKATGLGSGPGGSDGGACVAGGPVPCPPAGPAPPVTVVINLSLPVACPGHPLAITAVGTPAGGTYSWTIAGDAQLVDGAGAALNAGATVNLRGFKPDDATGKIPEQTATVRVTYTHPNGTAHAEKPVKIHKIEFDVTETAITAGVTQANEAAARVALGGAPGVDTMVTDPHVKIKLDASCPRTTDCAKNHRVGWLQTVVSNDRRVRFTRTQITVTVPLPLRDGDPAAGPSPFPFYDAAPDFTADGDTQTAHHFDSPDQGAPWTDPRVAAPAPPPAKNRQLRNIFFQCGFTAWLVVQNKEWSLHDLKGSFAFQKHFDWSIHLDVAVDTTAAVGSRCAPASAPPTIGPLTDGKGSDPVITAPVANDVAHATTAAAAEI